MEKLISKHFDKELNSKNILKLGDDLRDIFKSTKDKKENKTKSEQQSEKSSAGNSFEALICWYLNLCLKNSRSFVSKFHKDLVPKSVQDSLTITYGNFKNTSETDLIGFVLPEDENYLKKNVKMKKEYLNYLMILQKNFQVFKLQLYNLKLIGMMLRKFLSYIIVI